MFNYYNKIIQARLGYPRIKISHNVGTQPIYETLHIANQIASYNEACSMPISHMNK